jgi:hypothetical protein
MKYGICEVYNMQRFTIQVTVLYQGPFWAAIFERNDDSGYSVARKIFGGEPTDPELYEFILKHYHELKFTEPHDFKLIIKRKNPKRIQREVRKEMEKARLGLVSTSRAQEVLRLELEKHKKIRKVTSKVEKELKLQEKFLLRQEKKKKKKKGH